MENENNFFFTVAGFEYDMVDGLLCIDNVIFEAEASRELYALARAYWREKLRPPSK